MTCYNCGPGLPTEKTLCERCQTLYEFKDGRMVVREDAGQRALARPREAIHAVGGAFTKLIQSFTEDREAANCPEHGAPHCSDCAKEAGGAMRQAAEEKRCNPGSHYRATKYDRCQCGRLGPLQMVKEKVCDSFNRPEGSNYPGAPCATCGQLVAAHVKVNWVPEEARAAGIDLNDRQNERRAYRQRPGDQPLPIPNDGPSMHDLLVVDIQARKELGLNRYGSLLQAFNGRSFLRDAYEELLDLLVYLRGRLYEEANARMRPLEGADDTWVFTGKDGTRYTVKETGHKSYPLVISPDDRTTETP